MKKFRPYRFLNCFILFSIWSNDYECCCVSLGITKLIPNAKLNYWTISNLPGRLG